MKLADQRAAVLDALVITALSGGVVALWFLVGKWLAALFVGALIVNHLVGACVCAAIDDENQSLRKWADEAPSMVLAALITQSWPLILWLRLRGRA